MLDFLKKIKLVNNEVKPQKRIFNGFIEDLYKVEKIKINNFHIKFHHYGNHDDIVLFLPNLCAKVDDYYSLISEIVKRKRVLIPEFNCKNKSESFAQAFKNSFTKMDAVLNYISEKFIVSDVITHSISGAFLMYCLQRNKELYQQLRFNNLYAISFPVFNYENVTNYFKFVNNDLNQLAQFGSVIEGMVNEFNFLRKKNRFDIMKRGKFKFHLFHDDNDKHISLSSCVELCKSLPKAELNISTGFNHIEIVNNPEVINNIAHFFDTNKKPIRS